MLEEPKAQDNQPFEKLLELLSRAGLLSPSSSLKQDLNFGPSTELSDLAIDSFTTIELAILIEEELGISLTPDQILQSRTLAHLLDLINHKH